MLLLSYVPSDGHLTSLPAVCDVRQPIGGGETSEQSHLGNGREC